jgi:lipoprotein NlpD
MKTAPTATAPVPAASTSAAAGAAAAATAAAAKPVDNEWSWPTNGRVVQNFAESSKGIALGGSAGDAVSAAAEGKVIFSGNGPRGYGNLVIVKHANDLLSVYAHNRSLLVKEGQMVKRGQKIAEVGETGGSTPRLLFEIRQQGKPIDPATILPRR